MQVATYEKTTLGKKKNCQAIVIFFFFCLNVYNLPCLASEYLLAPTLAFLYRGPIICLYWHSQKRSFQIDFLLPRGPDDSRFSEVNGCVLPREPAVSLIILLFKLSPKQIFIKLSLALEDQSHAGVHEE